MMSKLFRSTLLISSSLLLVCSFTGIAQAADTFNPLEIRPDDGAARTRLLKAKGKSNPKAIVADNGAGKVLKTKKRNTDPLKVIEYPRDDGDRVVK